MRGLAPWVGKFRHGVPGQDPARYSVGFDVGFNRAGHFSTRRALHHSSIGPSPRKRSAAAMADSSSSASNCWNVLMCLPCASRK